MKRKKKDLIFLPITISYFLTAWVIKITFFAVDKIGLKEPKVIVDNFHVHHYLIGIVLLVLVSLLAIHRKFSPTLLASILGIALASIVDEFQFLLRLSEYKSLSLEVKGVISVFFLIILGLIFEVLTKVDKIRIKIYPLISVVVTAHNNETSIAKTILSLKRQNYPGNLEIIVVDNGSTDTTADIARSLGVKVLYKSWKSVHLARQAGFKAAKGELIASTSADHVLHRDWLKKLAYHLMSDSRVVASSGWYRLMKGSSFQRLILNNFFPYLIYGYGLILRKKVLIGGNFIVRKETFKASGGFKNLHYLNKHMLFANRLTQFGRVRFNTSLNLAVITSHKRFANGFFKATFFNSVSALAFAIFGKTSS